MFEYASGGMRENRRGTLPAGGVAILLHVLLLAALVWGARGAPPRAGDPWGDGITFAGSEGGGGGGGGSGGGEYVSYLDLAPPEPVPEPEVEPEPEAEIPPVEEEPVPPPPVPTPEPRPQPVTPPVDAPAEPRPAPGAGTGGGIGGGTGTGEGPGEGSGVGPGSGSGSGGGSGSGIGTGTGSGTGGGASRIRPPQSDVLFLPPDRPDGVAQQDLVVILRVDVRGRVRDARLESGTGDRGYDTRIRRWAMGLVFRPAVDLDTNRPVEAEVSIDISV